MNMEFPPNLEKLPQTTSIEEKGTFLEHNVTKRKRPTLEEFCRSEKISQEKLPKKFQKVVRNIIRKSYKSSEINPQIDFVYRSWYATRGLGLEHQLNEFAQTLDTFDTFYGNYAGGTSKWNPAHLIKPINRFIWDVVHPYRVLYIMPKENQSRTNLGIYDYEGSWIKLPPVPPYESLPEQQYVDIKVIEEIASILEKGWPVGNLFHGTTSAALEGIGRQKAILDARSANDVGEQIKSGEYTWYPVYSSQGVSLTSVHADRSVNTGYSRLRWFDEFPVVFGVSQEKIEEFLKEPQEKVKDYPSQGVLIGSKVPLEIIEAIFAPYTSLHKITEWSKKHCGNTRIISLEAQQLLQDNEWLRRKNNIRSPAKDTIQFWQGLLSTKPICL